MRRPILAGLLLACAMLSCAPLGSAASKVEVKDYDVFNQEGERLTRVAVGQAVRFQVIVENTGDQAYNGTLSVVFHIHTDGSDKYNLTRTVTTNQSLAPNAQTNVTLEWVAVETGKHLMETNLQDTPETVFTLKFVVAESEVVRASLAQMFVDYLWVYAAFVAALVLFFAVVRQRRTR